MAQQLSHGGKKKLTDGQIKRCLRKALKEANELHDFTEKPAPKADDGESPRNKRTNNQQRSSRRARAAQVDTTPKAEEYVVKNPRNPRDLNPATEIRETIRKSAETNAKKLGKNEADIKKAGDTAASNFERSIA